MLIMPIKQARFCVVKAVVVSSVKENERMCGVEEISFELALFVGRRLNLTVKTTTKKK